MRCIEWSQCRRQQQETVMNTRRALGLSAAQMSDLTEYLKSL